MAADQRKALKLDVRTVGSAEVLAIEGSAGMAEADTIRKAIEDLIDSGASVIVLDLSKMDFIGSAGLGALLVGHLHARRRGGVLKLAAPGPQVRGVLETTSLTKVFRIYDTVKQAVKA